MIRPFTLLTAVIFLLSGAYMFAIKHRAEATEVRIAQIDQQSRLDAQRIRVLQAQWALETDPDRLSQLAGAFTTLTPMKPAQLVTLAALAQALPAPGSAVPGQNPADNTPLTVPDVAAATPATALPLPPDAAPGSAPGAAPNAAPVKLAMAAPAPHAAATVRTASLNDVEHLLHHLNGPAPRARVAAHPVRLARATPAAHHEFAPRPTETASETASDGAQIVAARAVVTSPLGGGSLLGMAQPGVGN
jgi:hypothetical protein